MTTRRAPSRRTAAAVEAPVEEPAEVVPAPLPVAEGEPVESAAAAPEPAEANVSETETESMSAAGESSAPEAEPAGAEPASLPEEESPAVVGRAVAGPSAEDRSRSQAELAASVRSAWEAAQSEVADRRASDSTRYAPSPPSARETRPPAMSAPSPERPAIAASQQGRDLPVPITGVAGGVIFLGVTIGIILLLFLALGVFHKS